MQARSKVIVAIAAIVLAAQSVLAVPQIKLSETEFNFGKFYQNSKVSHTFWIKSTGTDTLKVVQIVPGCGCTQMPLKDSTLAPGDSTELEIIFSSRSMRGNITKAPYIKTNMGDEMTYLKIYSEVFAEDLPDSLLGVTPVRLDISQFGETPVRKKAAFTIENKQPKEVTLEMISYPKNLFKVTLPKKLAAGGKAEVEVEVLDSVLKEEFEKCITFETVSADSRTRYTVPVRRMYRANEEAAHATSPTAKTGDGH